LEKENQLISELEWIKNIAQKIDQENHNLMKKHMDLKAQYQTQENDREMLLKYAFLLFFPIFYFHSRKEKKRDFEKSTWAIWKTFKWGYEGRWGSGEKKR